jgi:hypothetical protein
MNRIRQWGVNLIMTLAVIDYFTYVDAAATIIGIVAVMGLYAWEAVK